jgi:hypothetical protein
MLSLCASTEVAAVADKTKIREEAIRQAAESRERAAHYSALSVEAERRGDMQMSMEFASKAAEEQTEALRIEHDIGKWGE